MKRVAILAVLGASVLAAPAHATLVTFDDLPGLSGVVQNGYGGINWNSNFSYFSTEQRPLQPILVPRDLRQLCASSGANLWHAQLTFNDPVQFQGFYASGYNWNPVSFGLYVGGVRVAFSDNEVMPTFNPQYVFSPRTKGSWTRCGFTTSMVSLPSMTSCTAVQRRCLKAQGIQQYGCARTGKLGDDDRGLRSGRRLHAPAQHPCCLQLSVFIAASRQADASKLETGDARLLDSRRRGSG